MRQTMRPIVLLTLVLAAGTQGHAQAKDDRRAWSTPS